MTRAKRIKFIYKLLNELDKNFNINYLKFILSNLFNFIDIHASYNSNNQLDYAIISKIDKKEKIRFLKHFIISNNKANGINLGKFYLETRDRNLVLKNDIQEMFMKNVSTLIVRVKNNSEAYKLFTNDLNFIENPYLTLKYKVNKGETMLSLTKTR